MTTDRLMTPKELADHLRVSPRTVRRLMQSGSLPYTQIGQQIRFTSEDVEAFVKAQRKRVPSEK